MIKKETEKAIKEISEKNKQIEKEIEDILTGKNENKEYK